MPPADRVAEYLERRVSEIVARRQESVWLDEEVAMLARILASEIREGAHLEPVAVAAGRVA